MQRVLFTNGTEQRNVVLPTIGVANSRTEYYGVVSNNTVRFLNCRSQLRIEDVIIRWLSAGAQETFRAYIS